MLPGTWDADNNVLKKATNECVEHHLTAKGLILRSAEYPQQALVPVEDIWTHMASFRIRLLEQHQQVFLTYLIWASNRNHFQVSMLTMLTL